MSMSKWQPIETAPRDGSVILVWWPRDKPYTASGFTSVTWEEWLNGWALVVCGDMAASDALDQKPTHWMQVEPPLIETDGNKKSE